jgi:hypothetical protein
MLPRDHSVTSSGEPRRGRVRAAVDWSKHPVVVLGSFVFGIVAIGVSIAAYLQTRGSQAEERAVAVQAVVVANQLRRTSSGGIGLDVSLSNASLRPVIIEGAFLRLDGKALGKATGYLADAQTLDRIQLDPGRVVAETRQLPFTVDVRQGRTVGIFIDDSGYSLGNTSPRRKLARLWRKILTGEEKPAKHHPELELRLVPGGARRFPVAIEPAMTSLFAWQEAIARHGRNGVTLGLRRKAGEPGQADVFRLDIWGRGLSYHKSFERPLIGDAFTDVLVRGLHRGAYLYAFSVEGKPVVTGCFKVPLRDPFARCSPSIP